MQEDATGHAGILSKTTQFVYSHCSGENVHAFGIIKTRWWSNWQNQSVEKSAEHTFTTVFHLCTLRKCSIHTYGAVETTKIWVCLTSESTSGMVEKIVRENSPSRNSSWDRMCGQCHLHFVPTRVWHLYTSQNQDILVNSAFPTTFKQYQDPLAIKVPTPAGFTSCRSTPHLLELAKQKDFLGRTIAMHFLISSCVGTQYRTTTKCQ